MRAEHDHGGQLTAEYTAARATEHQSSWTERASSPPVAYYDNFVRRLLTDYVAGNPRIELALKFALGALPAGRTRVLDIGCGIGWSSFEIVRQNACAEVLAVDLSPRLVATAKSLFGDGPTLDFRVADFIEEDVDGRFDEIFMLDVYEHFPVEARPVVHTRLASLLREHGRLVLTVPTPEYQHHLRVNDPAGLQPVDEDVTTEDLARLAEDLGGRLVVDRKISVWRSHDYRHALIERGSPSACASRRVALQPPADRLERAQKRLGMRWTRRFGFVSARGGPSVCIVTAPPTRTETFIRAHLERLAANVHVLDISSGRTDNGDSLLPRPFARAVAMLTRSLGRDPRKAQDKVWARTPGAARARFGASYLRRRTIDVVLAEYGLNAVAIYDSCRRAGLPVIPHFHGFDAFHGEVITRYGAGYRELFENGWPVVAASASMKRQLVRLGARADQVVVSPCGVDLNSFEPGHRTPGLVLTTGRFVDKKAPELALLAFAKVLGKCPDAELVMVGDGPLRPAVARLVDALDLGERVRLIGARDHDEVAQLMRSASVFMQHSVVAPDGDREGTPVAILEAGAAGLPVVATRHEGIVDVVVEGETGLLVDERDVDGMAEALAVLLRDPERARRMGEAAHRHIRDSFSMQDSLDRVVSILERAEATREH